MRRCASSPDILPQWFDVWNVQNFAEQEELQAVGLKEVVPVIDDITSEAVQLDGRWDRIILAGTSMGAATGVHTLLNLNISPAQGDDDGVIRNTPILLEHCVDDPLVLVQKGRELKNVLDGYGADVIMKEYSRGWHWFHSPTRMDDAIHFLNMYVLGEIDDW
ncbi:hypothetical protein UA08_06946 [Talaromyces atroroseus]|uniref:Phospholipase/carboxylesterase/thioesterase domain-containing protein n=1 Tax=Talaromyces atroroseus TaxID=1441469 RepID=A0A225AKC5_TALAT|nr:hypothetical protein UA08_06946 [Talaromyces atroroseus]OKL57668.1 hypothetical protein UA08_06946 [Talaromyces atroroseus]